jgi:hypothetical protein
MKLIHNILFSSGRPWAVQAAGRPFVYFNYNLAGDNTRVYSSQPDDWERIYTYDMLGRRLTYTEGELSGSTIKDNAVKKSCSYSRDVPFLITFAPFFNMT